MNPVFKRRDSRVVKVGGVSIGGRHPVAIQSMAKSKSSCAEETILQINQLDSCGCEIVRVAVKDRADALSIKKIKAKIKIPLVADIHFDYRLALSAIESGADKIRLNPGNIFKKEEVASVVSAAKGAGIPIRVGLNSGSVSGGGSSKSIPERLVHSGLGYVRMIEKLKFYDLVLSLKGSTVFDTVTAYRKMAKLCDYPLHLGVTATGLPFGGAIKTAIALGLLLSEGIGDTIRVSLTDTPAQEIRAARAILEALGLRSFGPQIISCPTCGRCDVDLVGIVNELEEKMALGKFTVSKRPLKVAVMGCVVNGPGEAKEADLGVAFGKKDGLLFKSGKPLRKVSLGNCVGALLKELER